MLHAAYVFPARDRKPLGRPELRMGVEVAYYLEFVEFLKDRLEFLMVFFVIDDALMFSAGGLETECMLNHKPVLKFISEQKAEALPLVDLGRAQKNIYKCIFREIYFHPFL